MLSFALFVLAQTAPPSDEPPRENLSRRLYYASAAATGVDLCDRERGARYAEQFNRRYGDRVRALREYHYRKFGRDPEFIILSSCRRNDAADPQQDAVHVKALDGFEMTLRGLERRFGPPSKGS